MASLRPRHRAHARPRLAVALALIATGATACGDPEGGPAADAAIDGSAVCVKPVVFVNGLLGGDETWRPGPNDSRGNTTTMIMEPATFGPIEANRVAGALAATRAMLEPLGITVTDVDPGSAAHLEVVLVGTGWPLGGLVASIATQTCRLQPTGVGLVNAAAARSDAAMAANIAYAIGLLNGLDLTDLLGNCMSQSPPSSCDFADDVPIPMPRCQATSQDQRAILATNLGCP